MSTASARRRGAAPSPHAAEPWGRPAPRTPAVSGWHESSVELRRGLEVVEHDTLETWAAAARDAADAARATA